MDVEFTVDIVKNLATQGPRAENTGHVMSMGIAGSLGYAMQIATSQPANWIKL
jgi:hypothetical protein